MARISILFVIFILLIDLAFTKTSADIHQRFSVDPLSITSNASGIQAQKDPKKFITLLGNAALEIINRPNITNEQVIREFQTLVKQCFAIENIARYSLGIRYKQLTNKEKTSFLQSFLNMLVRLYSSEFSKYKAAKFVVKEVKTKTEGRHYIVASTISIENKVIKVSWSVFNVEGILKIFDVTIESTSLSQIQRADIDGKISKSGFKKFLSDFIKEFGN